MKLAPVPTNELSRLQALLDYEVLDTATEPVLDELVEMASKICDTPIALISLVDSDRQWFKAKVGIDATQTGRDISFCGHAINGSDIFVVKDSAKDERFADNPLFLQAPNVRFYAGAPLVTPEGLSIGTLCVIDHVPRELTECQLRSLQILSRQVMAQLELQKALKESKARFTELQNLSKMVNSYRERLFNTDKMASLGRMAAGMAHEINNPLAVISGNVGIAAMMLKSQENPEEVIPVLEKVEKTVGRISRIISSLQAFSRDASTIEKTECFINEVIEETVFLCSERLKREGVSLEVSAPIAVKAFVNRIQISQVLMNLLNNAVDALGSSDDKRIRIQLESNGKLATLRVSDSGPGISTDNREKIMDPFFTTKAVGKGTGLGLSICKSIVEAHQGSFTLEDTPETTFCFTLPLTA